MIKVKIQKESRSCQGDIYQDIEFIEYISEKRGVLEVSKIVFPYVVVLTQDCELQQDYNFRKTFPSDKAIKNKLLLSVLVAPLYNAEHVFNGEHLSEILDIQLPQIPKGRTIGTNIVKNETPRYHYVEFPESVPIVNSIVDFKHYFSVNVEYLRKIKKTNYICKMSEIYRSDISLRFANYLSRIGLPDA